MIRDTAQMDEALDTPRRSRWWWFLTVPVVGLALVLARPALSRWSMADDSVPADRIRTAVVQRGDLVHDVSVQGRVVAASRSTLFSPAAGVVELKARQGERVVADQALAVVDSPELDNRLQQEQATLDALVSDTNRLELSTRQRQLNARQQRDLLEVRTAAAERELQRSETLASEGLLNEIELQRARDDLTMRRLELKQARGDLELVSDMTAFELRDAQLRVERQRLVVADVERRVDELQIRAPFDGLLAAVEIEDHDAVTAGQAVVGVVDLGELELEIATPETYADDLSPGIAATVEVDGTTFRGELVSISPEVRNGQVEGRVAFRDGTPPGLRQNQRLATRLILAERADALHVRRGPYFESLAGRGVYVVEEGMAVRRDVVFGATSVTELEILDGLAEGDEIVLSDLSQYEGAQTLLIR
ncbi:MAG: HlyD family efflux transporter periplasmic adaptor subunit [Thermoanaerobaculia bacterium]|nr:HlyD family efflux transporter periplasmic adaptor subunit [Thermoanaerobaculia bacterium]